MTFRIHIDTNVFVYAVGRPHPMRAPSQRVLALAREYEEFFTGAEVFQELIHRFISRRTWDSMRPHFTDFMDLMRGRIESVLPEDIERAAGLADIHSTLSARDLLHAAVMQRVGSSHIVTADRDFDRIDGITRLDPLRVDAWQSLVSGN